MIDSTGNEFNLEGATPLPVLPVESLTTKVIGLVRKYPVEAAALAAITLTGIGGWVWYSRRSASITTIEEVVQHEPVITDHRPLDIILNELVDDCQPLQEAACEARVRQCVVTIWSRLGLPDECRNDKNRDFLIKKLFLVIRAKSFSQDDLPNDVKKTIAQNIINNFVGFLRGSLDRFQADMSPDSDCGRLFHVSPGDRITAIEVMGDETHNRGAIPLLFSFENGNKIVYKPRSLASELAICGDLASTGVVAERKSLFEQLRLSTYRIYTFSTHGYSAFLENKEEDNIFETREELLNYYLECGVIEQVARAIGLGDLHEGNFIVLGKHCYLIDCEVACLPRGAGCFVTSFFSGGISPLKVNDSANRIYLSEGLIEELRGEYSTEEFKEVVKESGIYSVLNFFGGDFRSKMELIVSGTDPRIIEFMQSSLTRPSVEEARGRLSNFSHRIILCGTKSLVPSILGKIEIGWPSVSQTVGTNLLKWGFSVDEDGLARSEAQFRTDLMNNDVPVFYHRDGDVHYGDYRIGYSISGPSSSSSSNQG